MARYRKKSAPSVFCGPRLKKGRPICKEGHQGQGWYPERAGQKPAAAIAWQARFLTVRNAPARPKRPFLRWDCLPRRTWRGRWVCYAASFARPLARRARTTLRPFLLLMRFKKPCTPLRWRFLGWNVRFILLFLLFFDRRHAAKAKGALSPPAGGADKRLGSGRPDAAVSRIFRVLSRKAYPTN